MRLPMKTLPQILSDHARETPGRLAQRHKRLGIWREYSFADVFDHVRQIALGLHSRGFKRGTTLAVIGENEPEHFWAEIAAQALGGKVVSMYPDLTAEEIEYLLNDSETVVLFAQDQEQVDKALEVRDRVPGLTAVVYWDDAGMWSYNDPLLEPLGTLCDAGKALHAASPALFAEQIAEGRVDDIAVLSYTSGTTGRPKGVMLSHRYLIDNAQRLVKAGGVRPGMDYLTYISPAWATEQMYGITMGLALPLVVNFPEGPEQVLANLREIAVEVLTFAPRQWESLAASLEGRMLDAGGFRQGIYRWGLRVGHARNVARLEGRPIALSARLLYPLASALVLRPLRDQLGLTRAVSAACGGATMAPDVFRLFHAMGVPLRNIYGSTETGILSSHQGDTYNLETVGHWLEAHPDAGASLEWQVAEDGELLVRGGAFSSGYYRKEDPYSGKMVDGWYHTGDAVSRTENGELVFLERLADLRKLRSGATFPPQFVETRLRFSPFIKDIMTVGDETRDFVGALINIDMGVVSRWAEERTLSFSTFTDLSQKVEVGELLRAEIERVNRFLPEHARVRRFACFPKELDPDEGELTRSRKLRREFLEQRYAVLIDGLYAAQAAPVDLAIAVTYQDGRQGELRARVHVHSVDSELHAQLSNPAPIGELCHE